MVQGSIDFGRISLVGYPVFGRSCILIIEDLPSSIRAGSVAGTVISLVQLIPALPCKSTHICTYGASFSHSRKSDEYEYWRCV